MSTQSILSNNQIKLSLKRLAHQILENHINLENTVLIGLQPRGIFVSDKIVEEIGSLISRDQIKYGKLDITFYRDDVRNELHIANKTEINFSLENKNVILIDDVLWTGRTIRAALDAIIDFGRPKKVELCVLIDRRFNRELPIQADYVGRTIDSYFSQKVKVLWEGQNNAVSDGVILEG
ncbi:bifunctional pyr operon transcriptional regulator/uracil phosphoribosyltransferase PyrR [Rhizosphaericola mali]|uniref:Bifunctional pyr operon transcriptional regulator/uracil phosphoribosyltransferase PyrR n=1 Tax=Rhizosphaericola mali TaxID=2545455 RepID=A0A5P2FYG5_9BACT|nr:bifunctional pyr operon transcriptional regulator/uracil phosphoribosyltransferase PyrR [Rhizosphaericola mali]QES88225.1 bifunctional pyr operon transcriptional regulator/uracil phosphoribosyltransferase PyrR [Rhizosphaericola mali]